MQMNKTLSLGCVVAMLAGMVGVASAVNLLTNSTFETGDLTGWQVFGASANSTVTVVSGRERAVGARSRSVRSWTTMRRPWGSP